MGGSEKQMRSRDNRLSKRVDLPKFTGACSHPLGKMFHPSLSPSLSHFSIRVNTFGALCVNSMEICLDNIERRI